MSWLELYADRVKTAQAAAAQIESHTRMYLTGNCSVPQQLLPAITARAAAGELDDVEVVQVLTVGPAAYVQSDLEGRLRVNTLFIGDNVRFDPTGCRWTSP
jgi:4-hydroxybutyrate CoA-transferase